MNSSRKCTECTICFERLSNPKCLPCSHTFCCQCVENLSSGYKYRKQVPCPLCRSTFDVPADGCPKLPTNVYVEELLSVRQNMEATEVDVELLKTDNEAVKPSWKTTNTHDRGRSTKTAVWIWHWQSLSRNWRS